MRFSNFQSIILVAMISLLSCLVHAEEPNQASRSFQSICVNTWMGRVNESKDKIGYHSFGEKYCECAAAQALDNDEAVDKAIQVCIARTLLHHTMDSLEEDIGLTDATGEDISKYCLERWHLVYPQLSENGQRVTQAYCDCAKSKLLHIIKEANYITDSQYIAQVNRIATACS